ncbi:MAG: DUF2924 domain-containing protein [Akkermansia sp.]
MKEEKAYIISVKKNKGENKGRITRLFVNKKSPNTVVESHTKSGDFYAHGSYECTITQLLDSETFILLKKADVDKVKRHTGKTYDFIRKDEYEKTLAKRAATRAKNKAKTEATKREDEAKPEDRDMEYEAFLQACDEQAAARDAQQGGKPEDEIIVTKPRGKHQTHEIKAADGTIICQMSVANPEMMEPAPEPSPEPSPAPSPEPSPEGATRGRKRAVHKVILPDGEEAILIPEGFQLIKGIILIREHRGVTHEVIVQDLNAFIYEGTTYKTLTEVSWKAAGYQISGNSFFGLPSKKRA